MKRKKRVLVIILTTLIVLASGIKIYFAMEGRKFKSEIEQMERSGLMNYEIKSTLEHKTLILNENVIHYYMSGDEDKPAILFLHPAFSDHSCFYKQVDFFSKEFRVITVDLLGHGLSVVHNSKDKIDNSTAHITEIMNAEGIDKIHVVGVSMGSLIAQYFALEYPEKILSLTALGGYDINEINKEVAKSQQKEMFGWLMRVIFSMDSFRRYTASVSAIHEKEQVRFYESTKGFSRKSFAVMSGLNKLIDDRPTPARDYPLFILTGKEDNALAIQMAKSWHIKEPQSTYCCIENAGHCANMDNSSSFNELLYSTIKNVKE